jgi:hypothetical protein
MSKRSRTISTVIALSLACTALAADPPAPAAGTRPLLQQLNQETQSLYHEVQASVVRVQLPPPRWAGDVFVDPDNPIHKWADQLDAPVKKQLEQEQAQAKKGRASKVFATVDRAEKPTAATTQPATQSSQGQSATQSAAGAWTLSTAGDDVLIFRPNSQSSGALRFDAGGGITPDGQIVGGGGRVNINVAPAGSFTPNNIGLVLDGEGHILVPICVEKEAFDDQPVRVMIGAPDAHPALTTASFVGSDRQTNITILKLDKPLGTPAKLAPTRPQEGTLTMFLSPNSGVGRLMIWTNELKDWGVVVNMDGGVYGFVRQGQFLSAAGCRAAIDQLIKNGLVQRAKIGLAIAEVPQNDPVRESTPALGTQPAVRVDEVAPNSAAAGAGLKPGDLILQLNDQPVGDPHSFAAAMSDRAPQTSVKFLRDGKETSAVIQTQSVR